MSYLYKRPTTPTRRKRKPEEAIQLRICNYLKREYPGLDFHSDYSAGLHLTINQAKVRKALNSGRGWADLFIPTPSRGYSGLFLELKRDDTAIYTKKGRLVADEQIQIEAAFLARMNKLGYLARFAVGYDQALKLIRWYFMEKEDDEPF